MQTEKEFRVARGLLPRHSRRRTIVAMGAAAILMVASVLRTPAQSATPIASTGNAPISASALEPTPASIVARSATVSPQTVTLTVPQGTALHVALDKEVRVEKKPGQQIQGYIVEPVYAFDRLVIPMGTKVAGQITNIEGVSAG